MSKYPQIKLKYLFLKVKKTNSNVQGTNVRNVKKFSERYSIIPVAAFAKSNLDFDLIGPSIKLELLSLITKSRL